MTTYLDKQPFALQLLVLLLWLFAGTLIASFVSVIAVLLVTGDLNSVMDGTGMNVLFENINVLKVVQIFASIATFVVPAVGFAIMKKRKWLDYVKLNKELKTVAGFFSILVIVFAFPLIILLLQWNGQLVLPEALSGLENWMLAQEAAAEELTLLFLKMDGVGALILNLILVGVVPAFSEELLFRGVIQQFLTEWVKNPHVAILLAGMVFSFFHFQFYGFVPRMVLGMFLGYLFYWSGNLWYPILAHFFNNGSQVLLVYFGQMDASEVARDAPPLEPNFYILVAVSTVLLIGSIRVFKRLVKTEPAMIAQNSTENHV